MNMKGSIIGTLIGVLLAILVFPSIQLLIWGYYGPDWWLIPTALGSVVFGFVGSMVGMSW